MPLAVSSGNALLLMRFESELNQTICSLSFRISFVCQDGFSGIRPNKNSFENP